MRTNAGTDFQASVLANANATGAGTGTQRPADYMALSEDATAPAAGDTVLAGELTLSGLGRAQAAYAHTNGTAVYTLAKTYTSADATTRTIRKIGVFNAATGGTMVFESLTPSPPVIVSADTLTITETVSL